MSVMSNKAKNTMSVPVQRVSLCRSCILHNVLHATVLNSFTSSCCRKLQFSMQVLEPPAANL